MSTETPNPSRREKKSDASEVMTWFSSTVRLLHTAVTDPHEFYKSCIRELFTWKFGCALVFFALVVWATWYVTHHHDERRISTIETKYSNSNSFLLGRIEQSAEDIHRLEKTVAENKTDFNETKREKDAEILKLVSERDSVQQRLSYFEAMPANIMMLHSNILKMSNPTNSEQMNALLSSVAALTNALADVLASSPTFELYLNGLLITNNAFISLQPSRDVSLIVKNAGVFTAANVVVDLIAPLDSTNIVAVGWNSQPSGISATIDNRIQQRFPELNHWRWQADVPLPQMLYHHVATFTISTNLPAKVLPVSFGVYSDRSKVQNYSVLLGL